MSEHSNTQALQTASPESDSKRALKLQRKCKCGQHTSGGHECNECKKKRGRLQVSLTERPSATAMLQARPTWTALGKADFGRDFSRVQTHATLLRRVPRPQRAVLAEEPETDTAAAPLPRVAPSASEGNTPSVNPPEASLKGSLSSVSTPEATPEGGVEAAATPATTQEAASEAGAQATAATGASLLVADDAATDLQAGQMRKSDFLDELQVVVCAEAEAALAGTPHSTSGCPYLAFWFDYYNNQSSEHIEQALHRYVPQARGALSAADYIPLVAARIRQGVERWARTGQITGVPADAPQPAAAQAAGQGAARAVSMIQLKPQDGGRRRSEDPEAVQAMLGSGRALENPVRSRMESAFGRSFSGVRLHTDTMASRLSSEQHARAFTVGRHVAFGAGEYRPGTLVGDALIAHELAHVVQQSGTSTSVAAMSMGGSYDALEEEADRSAVGAVAALWSGVSGAWADIAANAMPRLRSGLRLSRCDEDKEPEPQVQCPTQTVTMGSPACGVKYGAIGKYCYSGAKNWWFKEKVVNGSPNTCDKSPINQTTKPIQAPTGCVSDLIFNFNGPPKDRAPCKDVTNQTVFAGPTKAQVEKCKYQNEQIIEVTLKKGSKPKSGKVITSSAGVSTDCDWTA